MRKTLAALVMVLALASASWANVEAPAAATTAAPIRSITFPVLGGASYVDTFGAPRSGGRTHQGQDLFAPKLRTLVAATDATVVRMSTAASGLSGNYVVIEDSAGWEYVYVHLNNDTPGTDDGANRQLEAFVPGVYVGAKVYAGQALGYLGDSGNAETTPPHLHFEIRGPDGVAVNPYESLLSASRAAIDPAVYLAGMSAGAWDSVLPAPGGLYVSGWAHDPDGIPGKVEAYNDGRLAGVFTTGDARPDVEAVRGPAAAESGFSDQFGSGPGTHSVCLWARNVGRGPASYLGCRPVAIEALPLGNVDAVTVDAIAGTATASGWALDLQTDSASEVHVYVNGQFAGWGYASDVRPDLLASFPLYSARHGFGIRVPVPVGTSSVCAYAIDDARSDRARALGCRSVLRTSAPFGNVDGATRIPGGAQLQGWAIDPDTAAPIAVHAYANGRLVGYGTANRSRPDIGAAFPAYGADHGFAIDAALPSGRQTVCLYGIDAEGGVNPSLGCRTVDVSPVPIGNLDLVSRSADVVSVQGWALDLDVSSPIEVHVLVDGVLAGWGYASQPRSDVAAAFPAYGPDHGFSFASNVGTGPHEVCVYAINAGAGTANRFLGCRAI